MSKLLTRSDFFFCYDHRMSKHLTENGIRYISKAVNIKSNRVFYLYHINIELNLAIDKFRKPKGGA